MIFIRFIGQFDFEYDIQGIVRSFYPAEELKSVTDEKISEEYNENTNCIFGTALVVECSFDESHMRIVLKKASEELALSEFMKVYDDGVYNRRETKNRLKRALYDMFHEYTGRRLSWGTLSGIRPTKITSALLELYC